MESNVSPSTVVESPSEQSNISSSKSFEQNKTKLIVSRQLFSPDVGTLHSGPSASELIMTAANQLPSANGESSERLGGHSSELTPSFSSPDLKTQSLSEFISKRNRALSYSTQAAVIHNHNYRRSSRMTSSPKLSIHPYAIHPYSDVSHSELTMASSKSSYVKTSSTPVTIQYSPALPSSELAVHTINESQTINEINTTSDIMESKDGGNTSQSHKEVRDSVQDNVRDNMRDNARDNVSDNDNVRDDVRDNMRESLRDNARDKLRHKNNKSIFSKSVEALRHLFKMGDSEDNLSIKKSKSRLHISTEKLVVQQEQASSIKKTSGRMVSFSTFTDWICNPDVYGSTAILDFRTKNKPTAHIRTIYRFRSLDILQLQNHSLENDTNPLSVDTLLTDVQEKTLWKSGEYTRVVLLEDHFPMNEKEWDPAFLHRTYDQLLLCVQIKPVYWLQGGYKGLAEYLKIHSDKYSSVIEEITNDTIECYCCSPTGSDGDLDDTPPAPQPAPTKRRPLPPLLQPIKLKPHTPKQNTPSSSGLTSALQKMQLKTGFIRPPNYSMILPDWLIVGEDPCIFTGAPVSASSVYMDIPTPIHESNGGRTPLTGSKLDLRATMQYLQSLDVTFVVNMAVECPNLSRLFRQAGMFQLKKYQKFACEDRDSSKTERLILRAADMICKCVSTKIDVPPFFHSSLVLSGVPQAQPPGQNIPPLSPG